MKKIIIFYSVLPRYLPEITIHTSSTIGLEYNLGFILFDQILTGVHVCMLE